MRSIKFRAWGVAYAEENKTEMRYSNKYPDLACFFNLTVHDIYAIDVMQYTGLKDKNGKEIYEGDIVKAKAIDQNGEVSNVLEVRFLQENARFCLTGNSYPGDVTIFYFGELSNPEYSEVGNYAMEVIGNIYEHPELIKS